MWIVRGLCGVLDRNRKIGNIIRISVIYVRETMANFAVVMGKVVKRTEKYEKSTDYDDDGSVHDRMHIRQRD